MTRTRELGFVAGVSSLARGFRFLVRQPSSWPLASVPIVVCFALLLGLGWLALTQLGPWLQRALLPHAQTWFGIDLGALVRWVGSALALSLSLLVAVLLAPALSAPALEALVRRREHALGLLPAPSQPLLREFSIGIRSQLLAAAITLPAYFMLWLIGALLPLLSVLVIVLQALLVSLSAAWSLFDYPLTLRGVPVRARLSFMRRHLGATLGFGLGFAALFWIPCGGIVLLPVGVVAAAQLVAELARSDPRARAAYPSADRAPAPTLPQP